MRRLTTLVAAVCCVWGLAPQARQDAPPPITFRSGIELVQLDVSVLDRERRPITGLTAADFTVMEDGTPRPIVAFTPVDLPPPASSSSPDAAPWVHETPADVASNARVEGGRLVVILLDRSIPPGLPTIAARDIAKAAVDELGPTDQAAVIFTGFGAPQNFTSDRARLIRAIDGADPSTEPSSDAAELETSMAVDAMNAQSQAGAIQAGQCYCGLCVPETIAHVAETLREVPRRKSLLFIGRHAVFQSPEVDCGVRLDEATTRMMRALDLANVTIHSFDPVGLEMVGSAGRASSPARNRPGGRRVEQMTFDALASNIDRQGSLAVLPDRTGGRVVVNSNAPAAAMKAVFAESQSYYLLAFESGSTDPGQSHRIEVRTTRRGARIQTRRRYVVGGADPAGGGPFSTGVAATLSRATAGAGPVADIPLQVSVAPFAVPGSSDADVILVLGMRYPLAAASAASPPPAATRREQIAVIAGAYDRYARPRASDERMLTLSLPADATGEVAFESLARLTLRPGSYEVRVAASSATGTPSGSVFTYVDVPAFASAALSLSGLVLEAPSAQPAAAGDVLEGRLPVVPTSRRTFGPADPVTAFLRIYQGGNAELRPVEVTLRLVASWGEVALERLMPFSADRFGPNRSADLRVDLPLIGLAAGEYLLAIEAREGDRTADRQLRLIVQGAQGR